MKRLRVPALQCRADEVDARPYELEWKRLRFEVLAYSEAEARAWWRSLSAEERDALLGLDDGPAADQMSLF